MAKSEIKAAVPADVRAWARDKGFEIGVRGVISNEIKAAWNKTHKAKIA